MSYLVLSAQKTLEAAIRKAAEDAAAAGELPGLPTGAFLLEVPADRANGDLASNAAMAWARELRMPPRKIAEALLRHLQLEGSYAARCETAGAGFLNFTFKNEYYADILLDIAEKGAAYGRSDYGQGKRVNVEFVSANPTGPIHMGNARGGALGDCLAAVLEAAGFAVSREFYVNDAGNQIEKFAHSLDVRYRQIFLGEQAVPLPEDCYQGEDIRELAREFADLHGDAYLQKEDASRREALVSYALPKNINAMRGYMDTYRIQYDTWFRESALYESGEVSEILALLKEKGLSYEKDGALWYKATEHGCEKDEVLVRGNGVPTYFAADIAYHRNKLARGFDKLINVWGADHHGHVARMKGVLDALGLDGTNRLHIVLMQMVRLTRNGEVVRMSKRTGKAITLADLLEEIPIDAVRFLFNLREPGTQMEFDLDLAVEQTAQNPVYYCQYAHARICSIFRKLQAEGVLPRACSRRELCLLEAPEERELIRMLAALTDEIVCAAERYDPARITRFCMELAAQFHKFYNACRVSCGDEPLMQARLTLCGHVRDTLANLLKMYKITAPESM
ncbi:MAG: arginine--tRNA ligase [Oscillospiraceae bacterium]|nr:arginine--tRNA ligase [Oscillospiraceae bacterium]